MKKPFEVYPAVVTIHDRHGKAITVITDNNAGKVNLTIQTDGPIALGCPGDIDRLAEALHQIFSTAAHVGGN